MAKDASRPKLTVQPKQYPIDRRASGSFHAGAPIPTLANFRRQSSYRYHTFPVQPPQTPLEPPSHISEENSSASSGGSASSTASEHDGDDEEETPLPIKQLLLLAFLSLSEQTALNSIGPYLPEMVASMPGVPDGEGGLYVGMLASAFALAQLSTNFLWGYASDIVGRKPILIAGTFSLMCCFVVFGLCKQYWQMVAIHALMGFLNGNAACVPTVLGEVTDRSNQSRAFTYLPVIYSLGSITGPALGGILVGKMGSEYPYLGPNILGAAMLAASVVVVGIWFEETLDEDGDSPWQPRWLTRFTSWMGGSSKPSSRRHSMTSRWAEQGQRQPLLSPGSSAATSDSGDNDDDDAANEHGDSSKADTPSDKSVWRDLLNHTTIILLSTYLVFQLSNISFNSLYPIFASARPPTGRDLKPTTIGVSLSLAGLATIIFQAFLFQPVKRKIGNLGSYRLALLGIGASMLLMPWVGYLDDDAPFGIGSGRIWLYAELAVVLVFKNICAVGGLSSVMLLITNSAPSHASLGTLNGVAQTLSALGRSIGPFVSGGLFTLSTNVRPKGEALAWSLFGGLALVGWCGSMFIRGEGLESEYWDDHGHDDEEQA